MSVKTGKTTTYFQGWKPPSERDASLEHQLDENSSAVLNPADM